MKFSELEIASVMDQILSAIAYCHSQNVVHNDLKLDNILIEKTGKFNTVKITNFQRTVDMY